MGGEGRGGEGKGWEGKEREGREMRALAGAGMGEGGRGGITVIHNILMTPQ